MRRLDFHEMDKLDIRFQIEQVVYLITDPDQRERVVSGIHIKKGHIVYELVFSDLNPTYHYDYEISTSRDQLKMLS